MKRYFCRCGAACSIPDAFSELERNRLHQRWTVDHDGDGHGDCTEKEATAARIKQSRGGSHVFAVVDPNPGMCGVKRMSAPRKRSIPRGVAR